MILLLASRLLGSVPSMTNATAIVQSAGAVVFGFQRERLRDQNVFQMFERIQDDVFLIHDINLYPGCCHEVVKWTKITMLKVHNRRPPARA